MFMRSNLHRRPAQLQEPQHIADILPDVLARYGLDQPSDTLATDRGFSFQEIAGCELPVVDLTADLALPLVLS
jgi:hypothetical protein